MIDANKPLDYRYLNMDTEKFCVDEVTLKKEIGKGATMRVANNFENYQILISGGQRNFTATEAILLCKRLSGILE